jgi:uncharacterized protein YbcC (UPF0753/DUF2309 family)
MNAAQSQTAAASQLHQADIATACDSIAPTWPLDRLIAVNPYWGRIKQPFVRVDADLKRLMGSSLYMPGSYYRDTFRSGGIQVEHLQQALDEFGDARTTDALIAALDQPGPRQQALPLMSDTIDAQSDRVHLPAWRNVLLHQVTQFCAAYFDEDQADWRPQSEGGLYANWLQAIRQDRSIALLMGAAEIRERARNLPAAPDDLLSRAFEQLALPADEFGEYLQTAILRTNGWAAWGAYLRWQARLAGGEDHHLVELLAVRLAWELLLDDGERGAGSAYTRWRSQWQAACGAKPATVAPIEALWQRAEEIAYQQPLLRALASSKGKGAAATPVAQVAFCIDVRSEVFRRALEHSLTNVQTIGFAGFFGLPVQYTPLGTTATRPQLPGLLAPLLDVTDTSGSAATDQLLARARQTRLAAGADWQPFERLPASAFTLVESTGLSYLGKLVRRTLPSQRKAAKIDQAGLTKHASQELRPQITIAADQTLADRVALARGVLSAMSLTSGFARLVLLLGHGSQSANNPHAAGLDCGACCGQTGEVNARALATLLNDTGVRRELVTGGIEVPETTLFMAGLHNTTTDEVALFGPVPQSHRNDIHQMRTALDNAGALARAERAKNLGLGDRAGTAASLHAAVKERANNWAQTRPEWGLANCSAFIVAPRTRSENIDLGGRSFLHDYNWRQDTSGGVLELIMTAPMIVTHWINMQYYASMVDNLRFGSGNKVLHNVVGGRIGVFEGNGGDLRIGLPIQSIHDGQRWMHQPLRLSVVIEAPRAMIDSVIANQDQVRQLLDNQWLYLFRLEGKTAERYCAGEWLSVGGKAP